MSSDQKIADIKRQLGEAVNRIESIQGGRQQPLLSKISSHFRAQGGSIVNVVLTASVLAVAFGRLQQKQQHEARSACASSAIMQILCHHTTSLCLEAGAEKSCCMQSEKKDWQENQQKLQLDRDRYTFDHAHYQVAGVHCRLTLLKEKLGPCMREFLQSRLSEQLSGLEGQLMQLKAGVQRELNDGGYRLGPVKSRLQEMLEDFATAPSSTPSQQSQQPNMLPLPGMTQQPASLLSAPGPVS